MHLRAATIAIGILIGAAASAFALGSAALGNQSGTSAKVTGHGYAFAGVADDPSAIFFNPAGLVNVKGLGVSAGASAVSLRNEHTAAASGTKDKMEESWNVAPYFYLSYSRENSPFAYGLGVNSPFGLATEWKDTSFSRYYATESHIYMYSVNPTVAYALNDRVSLGAGLDFFNVTDVELNTHVVNQDSPLIPGAPTGDGLGQTSGDGTGLGYNVGVLWKVSERHSLGLAYRSQVNVVIEGETKLTGLQDATAFAFGGTEYKTDSESEIKFPQSILVGYGFRPSEKMTIFADYEWVDWHAFKETRFNYAQNNSNLVQRIDRDWRATSNIGFGVEYSATEAIQLRGGFLVYESVIPNNRLESTLPDTGRWAITVGPGFKFGNTSLDLNYQVVFFDSQSINNSAGNAAADLDGKYEGMINVVSLGVSHRWGAGN